MKQIIYGVLNHKIDPSVDGVVFTEPFLRLKHFDAVKNIDHIAILEDVYDTDEKLCAAMGASIEKMNDVIAIIAKFSNEKYGMGLTFDQYKFLYAEFVMAIVFSSLAVYRKLSAQIKNTDEYCFFGGVEHRILEKLRFRANDDYYSYLYEIVLLQLGVKNIGYAPSLKWAKDHKGSSRIRKIASGIKHPKGTYSLIKSIISGGKCKSLLIRTFLPANSEDRIEKNSNGQIVNMNLGLFYWLDGKYKDCVADRLNYPLRNEMLSGFHEKDEYDKILKKLLINLMPTLLCESFYQSYKNIERFAKRYNAQKIYTANCLWVPYGYFFASVMKGKGTRIYDIQHSSAYGYIKTCSWWEMSLFDEFLSWGHIEPNPYKKMRAVACTRFADHTICSVDSAIADRILLITNDGGTRDTLGGDYAIDAINRHFSFVKKLCPQIRKKLTIRFRADVFGFREIYSRDFPEVKLEMSNEVSPIESIGKSMLIITDHNSSMYMEGLMMEKPCICYEGLTTASINNCMKEWIDRLEDRGLYYRDGGKLAEELNKGLLDIMERFEDKRNKALLSEYINYFLGDWKNAEEIWTKEFIS